MTGNISQALSSHMHLHRHVKQCYCWEVRLHLTLLSLLFFLSSSSLLPNTDHRIKVSLSDLAGLMAGEGLDSVVEALQRQHFEELVVMMGVDEHH